MKDLGWTVMAEFLFFFFLGYFLDQKFHTGYVWTFTGLAIAFALIGYEIWKISQK